jgi:hypothetical protein
MWFGCEVGSSNRFSACRKPDEVKSRLRARRVASISWYQALACRF